MEQYTNNKLHNELMTLSIPEIAEVKERYKRKYPDEKILILECDMAIAEKMAAAKWKEMFDLIQEVKSAPDSAATPSQGNENSQPTRRPVSSAL